MKISTYVFVLSLLIINTQIVFGQENTVNKIELLNNQKAQITKQEKEALKSEVQNINERLEKEEISMAEAKSLKELAAKKRAMNIENRIAIIDNKIKLVERNGSGVLQLDTLNYASQIEIGFGNKDFEGNRILGIQYNKNPNRYKPKYDIRTSSDLIIGLGFHNNFIRGESFSDTPHSVLGSRYFELGYLWKTRILKKSNWLRVNYGVIYENKGLKSGNQLFVRETNSDITLQDVNDNLYVEDNVVLRKSKFRQDAFIFPIHLEFGPSSKKENGDYFRYSTRKKFKFGIGAYWGFTVKNIQKIKFKKGQVGTIPTVNNGRFPFANGSNYTTASLSDILGWTIYAGKGNTTFVLKAEELKNILSGSRGFRKNVSLGLRFDL